MAAGHPFELADAARLPFEAGVCRRDHPVALNFMPDPALAVLEMRASRARRRSRGLGFLRRARYQRLFWDSAAAIDPQAGQARDRLFSTRSPSPAWPACGRRAASGTSRAVADHPDGLRELRRLLGAAARRPGAVRLLRRGPVGAAPRAHPRGVRAAYCSGAPDGPARSPPPPGPCAACHSDAVGLAEQIVVHDRQGTGHQSTWARTPAP